MLRTHVSFSISVQQVSFTPGSSNDSAAISAHKKSNAGAIAGGVIGGLIALGLGGFVAIWYYRRRIPPSEGKYNRESRLEPWKIKLGAGDTLIEPFPDVEQRDTSKPVMRESVVRGPVYLSEKSKFNRPGGLPRNPRISTAESGLSYVPPYPDGDQEAGRQYTTSGSSSSDTQSRRVSTWRGGSRSGTGYDADNGHETISPTSTDPSFGVAGTYVSPYDGARRQRSARRTTGSASTGREPQVLASLQEVAALRREVERIRIVQQEQSAGSSGSEWTDGALPPPPSYEDEVAARGRGPLPAVPSLSPSGLADEESGPPRKQ